MIPVKENSLYGVKLGLVGPRAKEKDQKTCLEFMLCDISRQGQKSQGLSSAPFPALVPSLVGCQDPLSDPSTEKKW